MVAAGALVAAAVCCALYAIILGFVAVQVVLLFRRRHKLLSYKQGFNVLTAAWTGLRVGFWADVLANPDEEGAWGAGRFVAFWAPHAVQFATFALLALFFVKTIYQDRWTSSTDEGSGGLRRWVTGAFVAGTVLETVFVFLSASLASGSAAAATTWGQVEAFGSAAVFAGLSVAFLMLGRSLHNLPATAHSRMMLVEPRTTAIVNIVLFFVFGSRSVFNVVSAFGVFSLQVESESVANDAVVVLVYTVWEVVPVVMLLATVAGGGVPERESGSDGGDGLMLSLTGGQASTASDHAVRITAFDSGMGSAWARSPSVASRGSSDQRHGGGGSSSGRDTGRSDGTRRGGAGRDTRGESAGPMALPMGLAGNPGPGSEEGGTRRSFASGRDTPGGSVGAGSGMEGDAGDWPGNFGPGHAYGVYGAGDSDLDGVYGGGDGGFATDAGGPRLLGEGPGMLSVEAATGQQEWGPGSLG